MLWAACCLGFFGFLREGEFTTSEPFDSSIHLSVSDVPAGTRFKICIKCSKTDPFQMGCNIYVGQGNGSIFPVAAIGSFLALRGDAPRSLFCYADGHYLSRQQLSSTVQSVLHSVGYPGSYSGHSFRIGAAMTATARGVPVTFSRL